MRFGTKGSRTAADDKERRSSRLNSVSMGEDLIRVVVMVVADAAVAHVTAGDMSGCRPSVACIHLHDVCAAAAQFKFY